MRRYGLGISMTITFNKSPHFDLHTSLTPDGKVLAIIMNKKGEQVAELNQPVDTVEDALILARAFANENPEFFEDNILVDTADETQRKSPGLFTDGGLTSIPEN